MPAEGPPVLIAAQSGRALAAAARRAGLQPLVADMFGDQDTLALAAGYRRIDGRFGMGLGKGSVVEALDALAAMAPGAPLGVVLGSGFEQRPGLIAAIDRRFGVIGASAETVRRLKDAAGFAALLRRLGVPHPPVSLDAVRDPAKWLTKRQGGSGGGHIRAAGSAPPARGAYVQARAPGVPRSLAFLADGSQALILAATEQWTAPSRRAPWRYGGAAGAVALPGRVHTEAEAAIRAIVKTTGLRGLASADLLVDGERWSMLEINPRPGATLDILDRSATPLLLRHIAAARGDLGAPEPAPAQAMGAQIVYARRMVPVVPPVAWPAFVMDRPQPGSRIKAGAPICTVAAQAADVSSVRILLDFQETRILARLNQGSTREAIDRTA